MAASGSVLYVEEPDLLSIESLPSTDNILGSLHNHLYSPTALVAVLREVGLEVLQVSRVADPSGKMSVHAFASLRCAAHLLDCERLPASAMAKFFRLAGSPYGAVADRLFA